MRQTNWVGLLGVALLAIGCGRAAPAPREDAPRAAGAEVAPSPPPPVSQTAIASPADAPAVPLRRAFFGALGHGAKPKAEKAVDEAPPLEP